MRIESGGLSARASLALAIFFMASLTQTVLAGGFLDQTQSAGAASVSTAGETAIAEDAATVYYNAAGMTLLDRPEILSALGIGSYSYDHYAAAPVSVSTPTAGA